jgi:hypothetical protein
MEQFPSNSRTSREQKEVPEEKKVLKLVETPVSRRKKTIGSRLRDLFEGNGVLDYVMNEVLVPAFKDTINDAVTSGMQRLVWGQNENQPRRGARTSAFGTPRHTNYSRYSTPSPVSNVRPLPRRPTGQNDFDDIVIATRVEAEKIINQLRYLISNYGHATVRDLLESVGETFHHTDERFGWTSLDMAGLRRVSNGYLLNLPPTEPLEY